MLNRTSKTTIYDVYLFISQTEIAKRLTALITQLLPFLQLEHQQQVVQAVDRAKQVTMPELNAIIGVSADFYMPSIYLS